MNTELNILLKKGSLFIFPIIAWMIIVVIVDPFNYFNFSEAISPQTKRSSQKLNPLLYNSINFKNNPTNSVIIGDSRIRKLPNKRIQELTQDTYYTLHSNAAKLNEIIDLFWFSTEHSKLKNVLIGINFNLYNKYAYANRVEDVREMINNPLIYIFNYTIAKTVCLSIKNELFGIPIQKKKDRDKFWNYSINTIAKQQYSKYKHPNRMLEKLQKVSDYCEGNNITLTLLIVPIHMDFHDQLVKYNLIEEEKRFKSEMKEIANVIDYDFPNTLTNCKSCFSDPIHTTDSISTIIVNEIFSDSLIIGKKL